MNSETYSAVFMTDQIARLVNELTEADFNLIYEAIEDWRQRETRRAVGNSMVGAVLGRKGESMESFGARTRAEIEAAEQKDLLRGQRATLTTAKLIQLADALAARRLELAPNSLRHP